MARPKKCRRVFTPPRMKGFKPFGQHESEFQAVRLSYEEFESLKMIEYDGLSQDQAAKLMKVSRPTITRIYNKALKSIARALVEGKVIEIEGGDYFFEQDWYRCKRCHKLVDGISNHIKCEGCPKYGISELIRLNNK